MASIFTYQDEPPRIHSPWSTPGSGTPHTRGLERPQSVGKDGYDGITRLEPEKQDGPCEYKLHLLLRARRKFVSMTTTDPSMGHVDTPAFSGKFGTRSMSEVLLRRPSYQPTLQTRQNRLQQLTTQLLWRLQQSSPFHSSSNAELVLPVLPEATPRLGVPERPAKLLPGLEESQGALYEIGVADDGALVGLVDDELDESLNNLRAMAASLGCVVEVLRKVKVGACEWLDSQSQDIEAKLLSEDLYVAEVLVRPDSHSAHAVPASESVVDDPKVNPNADRRTGTEARNLTIDQLRISFVGASTVGKSSLVGTLTSSMLDNGRGKSRLSLLKHRHEIASGVTSSVAQELVGYNSSRDADESVINYASGDVSSWTDIHNLADRLCFLTDSPGLARYAKSTIRALLAWKPSLVVFCISADEDESEAQHLAGADLDVSQADVSSAYLKLCLKLGVRLLIAVTKMDLATKTALRNVLSKTLSTVKSTGRKPLMLSTPSIPIPAFALDAKEALPDLQRLSPAEEHEIEGVFRVMHDDGSIHVPVIMTSAVTGSGIAKLHSLLRRSPIAPLETSSSTAALFRVDEVFSIPPSRVYSAESRPESTETGVVLCGHLDYGNISVGDKMLLGPFNLDETPKITSIPRSKSYTSQSLHPCFRDTMSTTGSFQDRRHVSKQHEAMRAPHFIEVRVVSLRNLRLPVSSMESGHTGTVGIETINQNSASVLRKGRKGMILADQYPHTPASQGFVAKFSVSDFAGSGSPPLILGGHAMAYCNTIRAAVKVTAVALEEGRETQPSSPIEMFAFDGDEESDNPSQVQDEEIKITFRFISTSEWIEEGDQILVVPTVTAAGPVAGPPVPFVGLVGFVGKIVEVHDH